MPIELKIVEVRKFSGPKRKITSTQMYKGEFLLNQGLGESVKLVWKDKERAEDKVFTQLEEVLIG